jgi:hypothetical protein
VDFAFALDGKTRLQGVGEIAWLEDGGKTGGLKFSSVSPQFQESLRAWLADDVLPKNTGREHTPAIALPLDSIDKIKSSIRDGKTEVIKAAWPRVEESLAEEEPPKVSSTPPPVLPPVQPPVPAPFQKPIVPSRPERSPLAAVRPDTVETPAVAPASDSRFVLPKFRIPSVPDPVPLSLEVDELPAAPAPPEQAETSHPIPHSFRILSTDDQTPSYRLPPRPVTSEYFDESPRLNRAAAFTIIFLALAIILGALVLSFRHEVGETLVRLGTQLTGEEKPQSAAPQTPANPVNSPAHSDAAPPASSAASPSSAPSDETSASTGASQTLAPPTKLPDAATQSPSQQASTIQQIDDSPEPEDAGSGQKEFDQAKTILKGNHRQRDIQMAVALLWTGVRKGYVPAEVTLADLYARGDGVGRSCEQARVLLKAAVQKGSPEGRRRLDQLKRQGCPAR